MLDIYFRFYYYNRFMIARLGKGNARKPRGDHHRRSVEEFGCPRLAHNQKITGSNPVTATIATNNQSYIGAFHNASKAEAYSFG